MRRVFDIDDLVRVAQEHGWTHTFYGVPRQGELFSTMLKDYKIAEVKWINHVSGLRALVYLKSL